MLRHDATGASLLIATTHIFWDPNFPHVKASQAELVCLAVRQLLSEQQQPTSVVLSGDWNSVPRLQPEFIPSMCADAELAQLPAAWRRSAVYELLSSGRLPPSHPEHPESFGKAAVGEHATAVASPPYTSEVMADRHPTPVSMHTESGPPTTLSHKLSQASRFCEGGESAQEPPPKRPAYSTSRSCSRLGALSSQGLNLRDAYHGALCEGPLPLTTHADNFRGTLDYIWVSGGDNVPGVLSQVAEQGETDPKVGSSAEGFVSVGQVTLATPQGRVGVVAPAFVSEVLEMPFDPAKRSGPGSWDTFQKIPDATWPSDHLAIGATIVLGGSE